MKLNYCRTRQNVMRARRLVIRATTAAGSGHPGGSFSMGEIMGCLFNGHLRFDAGNPQWEDRDRLVLSKGHAAPGLFSNLAVAGYIDESELDTLRSLGSRLQGHPDLKCPGVEFCGGSLGIGLSFSIGVALAARLDGRDYHVYTIIGDGESNEGQIWEAAMTASKYNMDNITAILDRNFIQQDSYTEEVMPLDRRMEGDTPAEMWSDPSRWRTAEKWRSFGWNVIEIDGHRIEQIDAALKTARATKQVPTIIIARTIKGKSVEHMEDNPAWHGKAANPEMIPVIHEEIGAQFAIAPSIIAGDMGDLEGEVSRCAEGRADMIHMDVMDGKFVPNRTFDHVKLKQLRSVTEIPFDTHLMIADPVRHVRDYVEAGSDIVTVHAEECDRSSFGEIHDYLRENQVGVGIAVNPDTDMPSWSHGFIPTLDQVIIMSVIPGRSGQKYIESIHQKTAGIVSLLREHKFAGVVEADGGVNLENIGACFDDGARAFVGGSAIVGRDDVRAAIRGFRDAVIDARRKMLLSKAFEAGGAGLVSRWTSLHDIGAKGEKLAGMARESGYV